MVGVAEAKQGLIDEFNKWVGSPQGTYTLAQPEVSAAVCLASLTRIRSLFQGKVPGFM